MKPLSIEYLFHRHRQAPAPVNVNEAHRDQLSLQDRLALLITGAIGTMWAVYFFAMLMVGWMLWQLHLSEKAFDPYPFAFLLFLGNIVQLLLMPLIMVGQNIQGRHAQMRAEEQYKTTQASYTDAEHIIDHLKALDKELILHRDLLNRLLDEKKAD